MTTLCFCMTACGGDDEDNGAVVPPSSNGGTQQTLPDPEGTVTARITNDGVPENGINLEGKAFVYMDKVNNFCIKSGYNSIVSASITNLGKVAGLAAIINVPTEGYADKVSTSEGDGLILKLGQQFPTLYSGSNYYEYYYRIYIAEYIRDALGNIIGATIKYQTDTDWVQKE